MSRQRLVRSGRARLAFLASLASLAAFGLAACVPGGPQSAFPGRGQESASIEVLFWIMIAGGTAIMIIVLAALGIALVGGSAWKRRLASERTVIAAGIWFPIVVLTVLLFYGFGVLADRGAAGDGYEAIEIAVVGERWWWRVFYRVEDGSENGVVVETANELHIPVGRPVRLTLTSADVIHSFWVPALAGKVDMVPGHTNTLTLDAAEPGIYRGQCAEYCGGPHALMSFFVVAEPLEDYAAWLSRQQQDAVPAVEADAEGAALFVQAGCGGCHTIRGTEADGTIGPELTHVGGRLSIGAGVLRTSPEAFALWIRTHREIKPENEMPPFDGLSTAQAERIAAYLAALD